ncbi:MAG: hypothetical protein KGL39_36980 [Patescibacteria group bacterium]|nr:hypothetical protein [Patescibacteria group bacterium]
MANAVLMIPPYLQFFDATGAVLNGGTVSCYSAGTTTFKAIYTDSTAGTQASNPLTLDSAGRCQIWGSGSYKFVIKDSAGNTIETVDNVTAYTVPDSSANSYFQSFSGDGTTTVFTTSTSLGTDEKAIMVWVDAGGGKGYDLQNPSTYTINGTSLTFGTAPASGTNNIYVSAPSLLVNAASASASAAATSETNAAAAAASAEAYSVKNQWSFDSSTTMGDPTTGKVRLNNATLASVTNIAISALTNDSGNPSVHAYIMTWDDSNHSPNGIIRFQKDFADFVIFGVNGTITDNTTWLEIPVTVIESTGSFNLSDDVYLGFAAAGNDGATAISGTPSAGQFATWTNATTIEGVSATAATAALNTMVGDSGSGGTKGLVPAPTAGSKANNELLGAGGAWVAPNVFVLNAKTAYGAVGNGTTDDTTAIQNWLNAIVSTGSIGYLPQGTYKITSELTLTYGTTGAVIRGDGVSKSTLVFASTVAAPNLLIQSTTPASGSDYLDIDGIGLQGTVAGTVLQIGLTNFSDAHNEPVINMLVQNFSTSTSAIAVTINYVLNGRLRFIADTAGAGYGAVITQANFCTFEGSYSAIGGQSIHLATGVNTGNVFLACDFENCAYCVVIANANTVSNTFIGGTYSYTVGGISPSAGSDNLFICPAINPVNPGTLAEFLAAGTGVTVKTTLGLTLTTPSFPASTVVVTNTVGQTAQVQIWGGSISSISLNGSAMTMTGGTFILKTNDTIAITYTGSPAWKWTAVN